MSESAEKLHEQLVRAIKARDAAILQEACERVGGLRIISAPEHHGERQAAHNKAIAEAQALIRALMEEPTNG